MEISDNFVERVRATITQSPVRLNHHDGLVRDFAQPVLLSQKRKVLNVSLKDAEDVIHHRK